MSDRAQNTHSATWVFFVCFFMILGGPAFRVPHLNAHELKNNTARLQLRDNHLRILVNVAILDWLTLIGHEGKDSLPSFDDTQIPKQLKLARNELLEQTQVFVNKKKLALRILSFPDKSDIMRLLSQFSEAQANKRHLPHDFGRHLIQMEVYQLKEAPSSIEVRFPKSLGEMPLTFEEPMTQWIKPGSSAVFKMVTSDQRPSNWQNRSPWILSLVLATLLIRSRAKRKIS
jgi:hypothetical protein